MNKLIHMSTIHIGSDHRGRYLAIKIYETLNNQYKSALHIPDVSNQDLTSCDYPNIANNVCETMNDNDWGILICGTGIGMAVAANKHKKNIIAAQCTSLDEVKLSREHNNARILCLGATFLEKNNISVETICEWITTFIGTETSTEDRHVRRRELINQYR